MGSRSHPVLTLFCLHLQTFIFTDGEDEELKKRTGELPSLVPLSFTAQMNKVEVQVSLVPLNPEATARCTVLPLGFYYTSNPPP